MIKHSSKPHHRRSLRLRGYDYSLGGAYFVTVCTRKGKPLFGTISNGEMVLSALGETVQRLWSELPLRVAGVASDCFVIMPNHLHGIIELAGGEGAMNRLPTVGSTVRAFKARVTHEYGHPVWQRNYYEHIIRDEKDYVRVAEYIQNNPAQWELDELYAVSHD